MTYTIRRCRGNVEAWCLDTGTDVLGPTAMSLDTLVKIIAGYEPGVMPAAINIQIDRGAEHIAAQAAMFREMTQLTEETARLNSRRRHLAQRLAAAFPGVVV